MTFKTLIIAVAFFSTVAIGASPTFQTSVTVDAGDVPAFMWQLNQQLKMQISKEILGDAGEAISKGQEYSATTLIHVNGAMAEVQYRLRRSRGGGIEISFAGGEIFIEPICQNIIAFSKNNESAESHNSCESSALQLVET